MVLVSQAVKLGNIVEVLIRWLVYYDSGFFLLAFFEVLVCREKQTENNLY